MFESMKCCGASASLVHCTPRYAPDFVFKELIQSVGGGRGGSHKGPLIQI